MRSRFAIGFNALLIMVGLTLPGLAAAATARSSQAKVEQAVIEAVPAWHGKKAQILDYLDLTKPFATTTSWALVVAQDPMPPPADLAFWVTAAR